MASRDRMRLTKEHPVKSSGGYRSSLLLAILSLPFCPPNPNRSPVTTTLPQGVGVGTVLPAGLTWLAGHCRCHLFPTPSPFPDPLQSAMAAACVQNPSEGSQLKQKRERGIVAGSSQACQEAEGTSRAQSSGREIQKQLSWGR